MCTVEHVCTRNCQGLGEECTDMADEEEDNKQYINNVLPKGVPFDLMWLWMKKKIRKKKNSEWKRKK